jgi:hypothetical protein
MILTVEIHGDGEDRDAVVAVVRILGPDKTTGRADYAVGAVEGARARGRPARSAGCAVGHDHRLGTWALLEQACAALRNANFSEP